MRIFGILPWCFASVALGQSADTVERRFDVTGRPEIYVRNEDGRTELRSHDASSVIVRATKEVAEADDPQEAIELAREVEVRIEQRGSRIEVETVYPDRHWSFWRHARVLVHVEVFAPRASDLDVATADGPLSVTGFEGELRLSAEDGDVRIADCAGSLRITAEDGDVEAVGIRGGVRAELEDGDLEIRGALSQLNAETEDGDINVRVEADSVMDGDWSLRAEDGRVRIALPEDFDAELDVRAGDGSIEIDRPVTIQGKFSTRHLTTTLGGGGYRLNVRTGDGSVRITKL